MKIAVSSIDEGLDSAIDPRFGRCKYFVVIDSESMTFESFANEQAFLPKGAGIQAANFVASKGVKSLLTGRCGPNAVQALSAAGVDVIEGQSGTVRQAVEKFKSGDLSQTAPSGESAPFGRGGGGRGQGRGRGRGQMGGASSAGLRRK